MRTVYIQCNNKALAMYTGPLEFLNYERLAYEAKIRGAPVLLRDYADWEIILTIDKGFKLHESRHDTD